MGAGRDFVPCLVAKDERAWESCSEDCRSRVWLSMQGQNRAEVQQQHDHEVAAFKRLLELGEKSYKEYEPDNAYTCRLTMEVGVQPCVQCSYSSVTSPVTRMPRCASLCHAVHCACTGVS